MREREACGFLVVGVSAVWPVALRQTRVPRGSLSRLRLIEFKTEARPIEWRHIPSMCTRRIREELVERFELHPLLDAEVGDRKVEV